MKLFKGIRMDVLKAMNDQHSSE
ncbi:cullin-3 (CUL-3), partial [Trichinella spiralis]